MRTQPIPVVLVIAGIDPTGGAGAQADIEAVAAQGGHAALAVSALTVQDTVNAHAVWPAGAPRVELQARAVLADMPVAAVKCGLLPDADTVVTVAELLAEYPDLPLVVDPVLVAGGGAALASPSVADALRRQLLPRATVATPNRHELRALVPEHDSDEARARALCAEGCRWLLLTGGDSETEQVHNTLYGADGSRQTFDWPRLPERYHGSGCTLAGALAGQLAAGAAVGHAVAEAQAYAWRTLEHAFRAGRGQWLPNRVGTAG